jgi:hypothetical protein
MSKPGGLALRQAQGPPVDATTLKAKNVDSELYFEIPELKFKRFNE